MLKKFHCPSGCCLPNERDHKKIIVHGAKEHHLKNVCFEIPKGKLVALTGPSGSGKSSIATDILQKECLRQFLESLGMTTDHLAKAKVDHIFGLSPSIGVTQRVTDFNSRSTVGTKTGILTILRNLFAVTGRQTCDGCGKQVSQPLYDKCKLTTIEMIETSSMKKKKRSYFDCPHCGQKVEKLRMSHFSPNTSSGACTACKGSGKNAMVDLEKLLNVEKSIQDGGVDIWDKKLSEYYEKVIQAAGHHYGFPIDTSLPLKHYTWEQRNFLLYGITSPEFRKAYQNIKEPKKVSEGKYEGIVPQLMQRYKNRLEKCPLELKLYILEESCVECANAGIGKIGRDVTVADKTISQISEMTLSVLLEWINSLSQCFVAHERQVLEALSTALIERVTNLVEVGLDYLTLGRSLPTLSAGESQRLRLAGLLGSGLTGVLYVIDEPTTGLHSHDTEKLVRILRKIQEMGNTVLIIEHDIDVIKQVDYIIDLGPGGGREGGEIVAFGTPDEIKNCSRSITGRHLRHHSVLQSYSPASKRNKMLTVQGVQAHNLKEIDIAIPVNQLVVLSGVSGSGKSTFLFDVLERILRRHYHHASITPGTYASIEGLEHFNRVVSVDQLSIGNTKSTRSNVATYTKVFDLIREAFASTPRAKACGFASDAFSFNASEYRCENCNGAGVVEIDMSFMPDVEMECPLCNGMRYHEELLTVKFEGCHISEVLDMTIVEARAFFSAHEKIILLLDFLKEVGLGYLTLGQSTSTLSGGEAQRIKLAAELAKPGRGSTIYLLDEPTTGLHTEEVEMLIHIFRKLVLKGNTVVVIEHHLNAISQADYIIDFGPGGGVNGGKIVAQGTPQDLARNRDSLTGRCLSA